ncbi:MAG: DNA topoisomerase I [Desulfurococcaceae archaeon]
MWSLNGKVVVIAEKPKASYKIATALSPNIVRRVSYNIPYYLIRRGNVEITIVSAAGHLFGLDSDEKGYPIFSYRWRPLYEIDDSAKHTYYYIKIIQEQCSRADYYVNACDYDIEGSVIGYLIIKFFGDVSRAFRAKFSSLTPMEIRESFNNLSRLDYEMIESGLCRHELDWVWGINISRALMDAVKLVTGKNVILSAGRVQTPTLKHVVENNIARNLYVPVPQYTISISIIKDNRVIQLEYCGEPYEKLSDAKKIVDELRDIGYLRVIDIKSESYSYRPPPPFNLGDLQSEGFRIYGFSPYKTQSIAEKLYLDVYISYPRTNSQKLPPTLNYRGILENLGRMPHYSNLVNQLLLETRGVLKPIEGAKEDPAHPAIYPTGVLPRGLSQDEWRIYDLIVRRFLATFSKNAIVNHTKVLFRADTSMGEILFEKNGLEIIDEGWMKYYYFMKPRETVIPRFNIGEKVYISKASIRRIYSRPCDRISRISLLKWMEDSNIGTESTRARIIELLFERNYLKSSGRGIEATDLGFGVIEVLDKFFPELTSVELTRFFEEKLEGIRKGLEKREVVVREARETISKLLEKFNHEKEIIGRLLGIRKGLIQTTNKCRLCNREVYSDNFCTYHYRAFINLKDSYNVWKERENLDWFEYLKKIINLRITGRWVREVAEYVMKRV